MQINIKTEYNFFNSTIALKDIIKYAKAKQITTIGICDCATTFGFYKFYKACIDNNIKPLIALELKKDDQEYLIYAKNAIGITRLNELNSDFLNEGTFNFLESEPNLILIIGKGIIPKQIIKEEHSEVLKNL
ncbi:MAG: PHP domain-containing protein, partial [Spiroplasma sp.]|nr:PHP domain-containing protein [Mycoplasmatales bacterium]